MGSEKENKDGQTMPYPALAMRGQCVIARAYRNKHVQVLQNRETSRFGEPLLSQLPKKKPWMQDVQTRANHSTEFYPVFFACSKALCGADRETSYISREASTFISLLVMLALECAVNQRIGNRSIIAVCYLTCVVADLEAFLDNYLEKICRYWHLPLFRAEAMVSYSMATLKKTLSLAVLGPFKVKGKTADVVFLLSVLRKKEDTKYRGLMTERSLLGMHYTRTRLRFYTFVHELLRDSSSQSARSSNKRARTETDIFELAKMKKPNSFMQR